MTRCRLRSHADWQRSRCTGQLGLYLPTREKERRRWLKGTTARKKFENVSVISKACSLYHLEQALPSYALLSPATPCLGPSGAETARVVERHRIAEEDGKQAADGDAEVKMAADLDDAAGLTLLASVRATCCATCAIAATVVMSVTTVARGGSWPLWGGSEGGTVISEC